MDMRRFVQEQAATLLRRLAFRIHRVSRSGDPEALHDLRVSIRRFGEMLRAFQDFFPHKKARKIRHQLRDMMDLAAEIRNRDIAIGLLRGANLPSGAPLLKTLVQDRKLAKDRLLTQLKRKDWRDVVPRWRRRLDL